jgi:hypothetical protein
MKIKRYNESLGNGYVATIEGSWTKERVKNFVKDHEDFTTKVSNYIIWKEDVDEDEDYVLPTEYNIFNNDIFVEYNDGKGNELNFMIDDIDEFISFLNYPELTKDAKNYNL